MDTFELYCLRSIFVITPEQSRLMTMDHHRGLDLRESEGDRAEESAVSVLPSDEDTLRRQILGVRVFSI